MTNTSKIYHAVVNDATVAYGVQEAIQSTPQQRRSRFARKHRLPSISPRFWGKRDFHPRGDMLPHQRAWLYADFLAEVKARGDINEIDAIRLHPQFPVSLRDSYLWSAPEGTWKQAAKQPEPVTAPEPKAPEPNQTGPIVYVNPKPEPKAAPEPAAPVTASATIPQGMEELWKVLRIKDAIDGAVTEMLPQLLEQLKQQIQVTEIRVTDPKGIVRQVSGAKHRVLEEVITNVIKDNHVWLFGPAGTGKTHMPGQVAEALGLRYYAISAVRGMSAADFWGRLLPVGDDGKFVFVDGGFLDMVLHGGLVLIDEVANLPADVASGLNALLSNGETTLQQRLGNHKVVVHPDFRLIVADNTNGMGSTSQFVRQKQDQSFRDRFRFVYVDYDRDLEAALCPDRDLLEAFWGLRDKVQKARLDVAVSFRMIQRSFIDRQVDGKDKWPVSRCIATETAGWDANDRIKVGLAA